MSCLDAYISRYGDFCINDNDDDTTDYFTPLRMHGVIKLIHTRSRTHTKPSNQDSHHYGVKETTIIIVVSNIYTYPPLNPTATLMAHAVTSL